MRFVSTPVRHSSAPARAGSAPDVDVDVLVVGAGASGLGTAAFLQAHIDAGALPKHTTLLVVERDHDVGGYCRTVVKDGFVFDYAGHFFHFRDPDIHTFVAERLPPGALRSVTRRARVMDVDGFEVPFPYQAHLRSLPTPHAARCLVDLWAAEHCLVDVTPPQTFSAWLTQRLGRGLVERFLRPYNEKLYATDLDTLDPSCMGRFFPEVSFADAMSSSSPSSYGYNATFTYPKDGAITYIRALMRDLADDVVATDEAVTAIDAAAHVAVTTRRVIRYRTLVSSAPLPALLSAVRTTAQVFENASKSAPFSWNKVLVFNLGFDRKGRSDVHWLYVAQPDIPFYRVGFYDVISDGPRMSLYVEVGLAADVMLDAAAIAATRAACIAGLKKLGIVDGHQLVAEHHVVMDPAYVHLSTAGIAAAKAARAELEAHDIFSIGRYGAWTYCSIEDNLVAARALVEGPLLSRLATTPTTYAPVDA